jgi:hypothetical protein
MKSIMEKLKGGQIYQARPSYDPFEWNWDTPTQARSDAEEAMRLLNWVRIYEPGHPDIPATYISVPTVWAIPGILGSTTKHHHVMVPPNYVPGVPFSYIEKEKETKSEVKEALDKAMDNKVMDTMFEQKEQKEQKPETKPEPKSEYDYSDWYREYIECPEGQEMIADAKLAIRLLRDLAGGSCPHCGAPIFPDAHQCKKCFHTFDVEKLHGVGKFAGGVALLTSLVVMSLAWLPWPGSLLLVGIMLIFVVPLLLEMWNWDVGRWHVPVPFKEYRRVHDRVMKKCARQRRKAERAAKKIRKLEGVVDAPPIREQPTFSYKSEDVVTGTFYYPGDD